MSESSASSEARAARFALARAQQAAYYAHKHAIEHPGDPGAQTSYRAANKRCDEAVAALREAERRGQTIERTGSPPAAPE